MAARAKKGLLPGGKYTVLVCQGPGCALSKSEQIRIALEQAVKSTGLSDVTIDFTGCHGLCQQGPLVIIEPEGIFYTRVTKEDVNDIVHSHLLRGRCVERLLYRDPVTNEIATTYKEIAFYKKQKRLVLRNCGHINPESIDAYLAAGGYEALKKVLSRMSSDQVIDEIRRSGLRGRGGAGFPTGQKWALCRKNPADRKYMICNADEGDPGAFMDRCILEGDPHKVIEGMIIAAYAIGASEGYIYCRAEYPLALKRLRIAMQQSREHGFLGKHIQGSSFSFDLHLKEGAGAFVCGEETALMASIEGRRGMPRSRPPYPAQSGLWDRPTNINNVKTLATIPIIVEAGADGYAAIGTEKSKGTAIFALAGKINNSGLVEVPMGTTLREIIFDIGGGIARGKRFKAVQTGGPSGGCLPAEFLDAPVDYETLAAAGSIMGSGGMIVLDEDTCMVDMARYFLSFTQLESCGKCVPCRWGTKQMLDILADIANGRGKIGDIELLLDLGEAIKAGSLCGLGQTAPNPVLSTIRHFRAEYESHIKKSHCPAAVCRGLVKAPCSHTCPAGVDVPRYIRRIAEKNYAEALAVIRERIPFPSVCGYVCFHPCEEKCRRGQLDEPIAIKALKRFTTDHAPENDFPVEAEVSPSGKSVAVVGSGPAGLTAAYYLAKMGGHEVTIYEALPEAGGMMRVGIPRYRLPREVLDAEIETVKRLGVTIRTNSRAESIRSLREQGYDAVFLAPGAHAGVRMRVEGEESEGVMDCVSLLRDVSLGKKVRLGGRVAVIGGGNAAMDAARTALRLGAKESTIIYRRSWEEMPASREEIREALQEGVKIEYLLAPTSISRWNGHLRMECIRMQLGRMDASGRRRPEPVAGTTSKKEFDAIISAIGQFPQISEKMGIKIGKNGALHVDAETSATEMIGVFAGGDAVSGPSSVIEAIADGRRAAISIDRYLGGRGLIEEKLASPEDLSALPAISEEDAEKYRPKMPVLSPRRRIAGFRVVERGFPEASAIEEAKRCLRCDLETD